MSVFDKIDFDSAKNIEMVILKWIWVRRYRVLLFVLTVLLLIVFSKAPYVNLFFNDYLTIFVSAILAPFILDIDDRPLFKAVVVLFTVVVILWFTDRDSAEITINYIFIILFAAVGKALFSSGRI